MTQGATVDEVVFVRSPSFLELRYQLSQVNAVAPGAAVTQPLP